VTNNIYLSAAPAQNYLPERCSAAFRHHYSPVLHRLVGAMISASGKAYDLSKNSQVVTPSEGDL